MEVLTANIIVQRSTLAEVEVSWHVSPISQYKQQVDVIVLTLSRYLPNWDHPHSIMEYKLSAETVRFKIPCKLEAGCFYHVTVCGLQITGSTSIKNVKELELYTEFKSDEKSKICVNELSEKLQSILLKESNDNASANWYQSFKTCFRCSDKFRSAYTQNEVVALMKLCQQNMLPTNDFIACLYFFRDKFSDYWDEILQKEGGIMKPYLKRNNGDPASPINDALRGLYFSTRVDPDTMKPPAHSMFGPFRFQLFSTQLFNESSRLYFSDFYCYGQIHFVTLVLTVPNSPTDKFCQTHLVELNIRDNDFLKCVWLPQENVNIVFVTKRLTVEVVFTESIPISGKMLTLVSCSRTTQVSGRTKELHCETCNLPAYRLKNVENI